MITSKSLAAQKHEFSESLKQLQVLNNTEITPFSVALKESGLFPLRSDKIEILQINLGKMCNQVCSHCHVDAGPDRKEIMTRETMQLCLDVVDSCDCTTVDLTGGAPEMNPDFRWFVAQLTQRDKKVIVRCNLTIIVANKKYYDLPEFFKKHKVEVVSSLPCYTSSNTDAQRGSGVFTKSIKALQMLNDVGYGVEGSDLELNLVYNPGGAFLPPVQASLEKDYKKELHENFNIHFNNLFAITNVPISRFLEYLVKSNKYEEYMETLLNSFNPQAATNVMCKNSISVGWDGYLYDCDFNQILELKVGVKAQHLSNFNLNELDKRNIIVNKHCYACTAGAGSSCGGTIA